ncbi:MAG: FAD-dependent oxidoreductase [Burkholderiales bacterium]|nr:FAD-dependent oxidoreductase [Burkholderiales bacterium]
MTTSPVSTPALRLAHGLLFEDLYRREGLLRLDQHFVATLQTRAPELAQRLRTARQDPVLLTRPEASELIVALAPHLESFLARLFGIEAEVEALAAGHLELAPLYAVKRGFVQRRAMAKIKPLEAEDIDGPALETRLAAHMHGAFSELGFARLVTAWLADEPAHTAELEIAARYAAWAGHTAAGRRRHAEGILFKVPAKLDPLHLVPLQETVHGTHRSFHAAHLRRREGFALTDRGTDLMGALDQANYCIWCHEQQRDSCSSGMREKVGTPELRPPFKKSPFGVPLNGCPLDERISEFHKVKVQGHAIGALGIICVDNPMVAATGHRICNDCMKACIYQKQEPVNIPQAETRTLKDVLALPWGFEIYSLLTRWNPLDLHRPLPRPASGRRVLVVGMGPAGYTLAHHLMNDGHVVVGIDGLKIEPLPAALSGIDAHGKRAPMQPVHDVNAMYQQLDERTLAGFGGVAEYGITVRWDKNFLKLVRLLLERREQFALIGGVRFGGTITAEDAFAYGFDHIALAAGAGRPTVLELPNGLARGVRTASDFLMALQLTGAAKTESVANLQIRLPVVVIGGGLTAIDTATESLAYYPLQVEKFLHRYETLAAERGEATVRRNWSAEEQAIAEEFLMHARAIREERAAANAQGRAPHIIELLRGWGGATIAYRKRLIDSPSYTLNHEEVEKALEEGILFAEGLTPVAVEVDAFGHASGLTVSAQCTDSEGALQPSGETVLPARTILVAAGTQPNTVLAREDSAHFPLDGRYFQACDENGNPVQPQRSAKPDETHVLLAREPDGRFISFFGDLHPSFFGNVVKAMGGARRGYPVVSSVLAARTPASMRDDGGFLRELNDTLRATVHEVVRLTPNIVEVVVHAPAAARRFQPGQFYRLQNFERNAALVDGTRLAMEGLALTGAWVDRERGLVSTIVLEMGGSSDLCAMLAPGEPVILMGPTGTPTEIHANETVVLVGGGLGNAVLFSIGQALRQAGSKVLYFAGYKKRIDRYKVAEIEAAADVVVWCCDEAPGFEPSRRQDRSFVGNIVQAMLAYAEGKLGEQTISLADTRRLIAIGSDRMMAAVGAARHGVLAAHIPAAHVAIGSINSPMQCMMKEICAQCLQPHVDPVNGARSYVFSCFNQDQPLDAVDFPGLAARLSQNSLQEKLTAQWIDRCLVRARRRVAPV